ncbi:tripartite motif-containing protein 16-like isoform X1 [Polypterus senegalus]|uniref:tripartite motif-containing protein 16-like isoform X1 n=1 Tax=Polypterus senegalus TaxID=55291 RepID=UPI001966527E|nr:tripartite motif-containing protein 16-like isoform X1 [Polypterus senegalus]
MAAATSSLSADEYTCSVCLDVLTKPVTIPCGHSYCMDCINDYWDQLDTLHIYRCPQCRRQFNIRPELNKNVLMAEVIENLKEVQTDVTQCQNSAGPDDLLCDVCPGRQRKAVKTCLTCMASYCQTHIQPHQEFEALKRHNLEEPIGKLEEKLCTKHNKVLEMFCRTDKTCICLLCVATDHKNHDTVSPDEERAGRQSLLENRKAKIKKRIQEKEKKMDEMKETVASIQSCADREVHKHVETFSSLLQSIERLRSEVIEVIKNHERREVRKAEEIMEQLEKQLKDLKRRDAELAMLSQTSDHIHFLKKLPSLCVPPEDKNIPNFTIDRDLLPETLIKDLSALKKCLQEISGWEFVKTSEIGFSTSGFVLQNLKSRNYFLKYSCPLTLDPNTAHKRLSLSERNKKMTSDDAENKYPDHPDRFDCLSQVLCREALSGPRCYWEVEWSGFKVAIGVAHKGIERKGKSDECRLGSNDKSWSLFCSDSRYSVRHSNNTTVVTVPNSPRIGVYLDRLTGSLSFYSVSHPMILLHRFDFSFNEPLYAGFWVLKNSSVTICPLSRSIGDSMFV